MSLRIVRPGVLATVQDLGRPGHGVRGVPVGGAVDWVSFVLANRLVGNADGAAAIEMALVGVTVEFERDAVIAITGAGCAGVPMHEAIHAHVGDRLALGPLRGGARAYLAIAGGVDVPRVLGSRSTLAAAGLGGVDGRALRAGDVLTCVPTEPTVPAPADAAALAALHDLTRRSRLRVTPGPHGALLGPAAIDVLSATTYRVSDRSDRVGIRLDGPPLPEAAAGAGEMVTEPMTPGAVQSPPAGGPIVLGPDAPVTGGYPVVAAVIGADLPALGQFAPRDTVSFEGVSLDRALTAYRDLHGALDRAVRPAPNNRTA